jgi:hypothetical protein
VQIDIKKGKKQKKPLANLGQLSSTTTTKIVATIEDDSPPLEPATIVSIGGK